MTRSYDPGELKLAVLGDLLRNPLTKPGDMRTRLDTSPDILRVTLERMVVKGWVRKHEGRFLIAAEGRTYVRRVREMLSSSHITP